MTGGDTDPNTSYISDVLEYNTVAQQWQPASTWPQLETARRFHGCAVVGSTAVVAGGAGGGASTELFNLVTKARIPGGALQSARYVKLVSVGSGSLLRILAFGNDLVEEWQEETATWKEAGRLEESRGSAYMGAVVVTEGLVCKK